MICVRACARACMCVCVCVGHTDRTAAVVILHAEMVAEWSNVVTIIAAL